MAASERTGVVDSDCAVFGLPNLYVASSAVFPTQQRCAIPTLTITALRDPHRRPSALRADMRPDLRIWVPGVGIRHTSLATRSPRAGEYATLPPVKTHDVACRVTLSVCIATYKRLDRLDALLADLERQELRPDEIVIVDNDAAGSARAVVEARIRAGYSLRLLYEVQPERNISLTRNRTVALASGDWLAFVDDDERAPANWLRRLMEAGGEFRSRCILAPVEPQVPDSAPSWIRRGRFYEWPRLGERRSRTGLEPEVRQRAAARDRAAR